MLTFILGFLSGMAASTLAFFIAGCCAVAKEVDGENSL